VRTIVSIIIIIIIELNSMGSITQEQTLIAYMFPEKREEED
jgi:hypothetical protein